MLNNTYDVAILGAGIVGCSIAWKLCRTNKKILLIEKANDIANGATRANSGILHSGIHEDPNSKMYQRCRDGLQWFRKWCQPLDFPLIEKPTLITAQTHEQVIDLELLHKLHCNNIDCELINNDDDLRKRYSFLNTSIKSVLSVKDSAQICPYEATRAMLENAKTNGLDYLCNTSVISAKRIDENWHLAFANGDTVVTKKIILSAGKGMIELEKLFKLPELSTKLLSGAYYLLEKNTSDPITPIVFGPRNKKSKGLIVQETVHGNILIGPDSHDIANISDQASAEGEYKRLENIWERAQMIVPNINRKSILRVFTGKRVVCSDSFQIHNYLKEKNIISLNGIKSPGLTVSPVLAQEILDMLKIADSSIKNKEQTIDTRKSIKTISAISTENPEIICRCEKVRLEEITEAIKRGATSIEDIRWFTRAGMGNCQGSFCRPKIIEILAKQTQQGIQSICQKNPGSEIVQGNLK